MLSAASASIASRAATTGSVAPLYFFAAISVAFSNMHRDGREKRHKKIVKSRLEAISPEDFGLTINARGTQFLAIFRE